MAEWAAHFDQLIGEGAEPIAWWQMTLRGALIFVWGLILVRFAGRRAFGRYTSLDIVLAVIIGSNLSRTLTANAPLLATMAATTALVTLYWASVHVVARSSRLGWLVKGDVVQLVRDGRADRRSMRRSGVSEGDLQEAMRSAGVGDIALIREAVLERNGKISIIRR